MLGLKLYEILIRVQADKLLVVHVEGFLLKELFRASVKGLQPVVTRHFLQAFNPYSTCISELQVELEIALRSPEVDFNP